MRISDILNYFNITGFAEVPRMFSPDILGQSIM